MPHGLWGAGHGNVYLPKVDFCRERSSELTYLWRHEHEALCMLYNVRCHPRDTLRWSQV